MWKPLAAAAWVALSVQARGQDYTVEFGSPQVFALCYENNVDSALSCACGGMYPLVLNICVGQIEACCDQITVYDGLDNTAPILFANSGSGELGGMLFTSTNPDHALCCEIVTNGTNSCVSEGYVPIVFSVSCEEAVGCDIGMPEGAPERVDLFPQPSDGAFTIHAGFDLSEVRSARVFDYSGRVVHDDPLLERSGPSGTVNLRHLAPGRYVLHMIMRDRTVARGFSIVH